MESCLYLLCDIGGILGLQDNMGKFDKEVLKKLKRMLIIFNTENPVHDDAIMYFEKIFRF